MKLKRIILLLIFSIFPLVVHASGGMSVNKTNINVARGSSATFTVKANNAAGRVDISNSNSGVASISSSGGWLDNDSITVTVKGLSNGSTTITVKATDMATYDSEVVSNVIYINVNVTEPLSGNNGLASISVDGYDLIKISDTEYTLSVSNGTTSITINAEAADAKATVSGTGTHDLNVGENVFPITIKAANGSTKTYNVIVTRKNDTFTLDDLDDFKDSEYNTIIIHNNDIISSDHIGKIKGNKSSTINFVNNDNDIKYTLVVKKSDLDKSFDGTITFTSKNDIGSITNYAAGISVVSKNLPKNTSIKLTVPENLAGSDKLNLYRLENGKLIFVKTVDVKNGEIQYEIDANSEYFVTPAKLAAETDDEEDSKEKSSTPTIIIIIVGIILIIVIIVFIIITSKKKGGKEFDASSTISSNTIEPKEETISPIGKDMEEVNNPMSVMTEKSPFDEAPSDNDFISFNSPSPFQEEKEVEKSYETSVAEAFPSLYEDVPTREPEVRSAFAESGDIKQNDIIEPLPVPDIDIVNTGDLPLPISLPDDVDEDNEPTIV